MGFGVGVKGGAEVAVGVGVGATAGEGIWVWVGLIEVLLSVSRGWTTSVAVGLGNGDAVGIGFAVDVRDGAAVSPPHAKIPTPNKHVRTIAGRRRMARFYQLSSTYSFAWTTTGKDRIFYFDENRPGRGRCVSDHIAPI